MLVAYGSEWKTTRALGVHSKELSNDIVDFYVRKMDLSGHRGEKVTFKSDGEAAITAVKRAIAAARVVSSPLIETTVRESKGNGAVGRAVRTWQGQFRTLKAYFEDRSGLAKSGRTLPLDHLLTGWLVNWTCEVYLKWGGCQRRTPN